MSPFIRRPKMTMLSLSNAALSIFRGRKSFIPPSILFPEGVSVKLRRIGSPFSFEIFEKELHNKGGG